MQRLDPVGSHDTDPFAEGDVKSLLAQALFVSNASNGDQKAISQWLDTLFDEERQRLLCEAQSVINGIVEWWNKVISELLEGVDMSALAELAQRAEEQHE